MVTMEEVFKKTDLTKSTKSLILFLLIFSTLGAWLIPYGIYRLIKSGGKKMIKQDKLKKQLIKILGDVVEKPITIKKSINLEFGVLDPAKVLLIIGKTNRAKMLLSKFVEKQRLKDYPIHFKEPESNYISAEEKENKTKFSIEYVGLIIELFKLTNDCSFEISIKKDYPMTIEGEEFKVILAPRVEN